MALSKEEKKALKKRYQENIKHQETSCLIISNKITVDMIQKDLIPEINKIGINCALSQGNLPNQFILSHPKDSSIIVTIEINKISDEIIDILESYEHCLEKPLSLLNGVPYIKLSGQTLLSPVIDLLYMTAIRALGRLSKGINACNEFINEDWLAWSLDYMGDKMSDVNRVYDEECPNFEEIINNDPSLSYSKKWWKF